MHLSSNQVIIVDTIKASLLNLSFIKYSYLFRSIIIYKTVNPLGGKKQNLDGESVPTKSRQHRKI
jgi:hypothetical protein